MVILDFSESYAFIIKDAIEGYYWDKSEATVQLFVIYYRGESGDVSVMNLFVFSDSLICDAIAVHVHICTVMAYVKNKLHYIHFAIYFSGGAASQYKNLKNLCTHYHDFQNHAQQNFFATSRGKNVCDGIGATIKCMASQASLQHPTGGHILKRLQLFTWVQKNISGILSFYVSKDELKSVEELLKSRLENIKTVAGARSHHHFSPVDSDSVQVCESVRKTECQLK